ncbi:hypothetical protein LOTGIDRAFT_152473 [Lottia gigantea]|uniref:Uncharacterized protein n=1 Tax=Lottia gigantea TaxID=225164 RepID=V4BI59_LOTGI|nr:hypothetical protein LOTGIDRAFT_152473 [Lottia gigantea]ESP05617.1 hypothetical protein LOTGIDRAFT_152473 [Lottia gigantea]
MRFDIVTNPVDVIKIRMQLDNELASHGKLDALKNRYYHGFAHGAVVVYREEGFRGLCKGLAPSMLRDGLYSGFRMGAYEPIKVLFGATDPAHTPLWKKICAGAIAGAIGSSICTPTDLVKVRLQAQRVPKPGESLRYPSMRAAFKEIFQKEGIRGLYVGIGPTVKRAAILTATQIPAYDHTKHTLLNSGLMVEGPKLHIVSSMVAGLATALTTSPVDVVKTRIMNQHSTGQVKSYHSAVDCLIKTFKSEGVHGLYKGFIPNWLRLGPHTIVTFFIFEQLRHRVGIRPI